MTTYPQYPSAPSPYGVPPPPPHGQYPDNDRTQQTFPDTAIPVPATAGDGMLQQGKPWRYFFGGILLGLFAGVAALIPLCIFRELIQNRRNKKFYLFGAVPMVVLDIVLLIILIIMYSNGTASRT